MINWKLEMKEDDRMDGGKDKNSGGFKRVKKKAGSQDQFNNKI